MFFHPTRLLARAVQLVHVTAMVFGVAYFLAMLITWIQHDGGDHVYMSDAVAIVSGAVQVMVLPGLLVSGLLFLLWMARTYHNVPVLGGVTSRTPRSMLMGWFIPFLSLYRPLHAMREIWVGTDPARNPIDPHEAEPGDAAPAWSTMIVDAWWGLWLLSNFTDRLVSRLDASPMEEYFLLKVLPLHLLSAVLWTIGAYLVFRIVGRVTQGQYDRLSGMPHIETQPVQRQRWGLVSALLVPLSWGFAAIWALVGYLELSQTVATILGVFVGFVVVTGLACGLRATWNNSPKPATGVIGVFCGLLNLPACLFGFTFLL